MLPTRPEPLRNRSARQLALGLALLAAGFASAAQAQQVVTMPRAVGPISGPGAASLPQVITMPVAPVARPQPIDRWAAHIAEAAERFGIPESWIREVMRMESGGNATALSWANAMGLMQVIPSTYATLRWQHNLGPNPYDPRDNILAGAAYIREMYDLYGFPGFLAAYNGGPRRVDGFMLGQPLPAETVNYLAVLSPRLEGTTQAEGPLAAFVRNPNTNGGGPMVIDMARALAATPATTPGGAGGPQVINLGGTMRVVQPPRDAAGLVPRGMLGGPQLIQMPSPTADQSAPIPIPAPVLLGLNKPPPRR